MASVVAICNRALQKLGAESRITSLTEDTPNARECNAAYEILRDAELRAHPWKFAIERVALGSDGTTPVFGYTYRYSLPVDCLRVLFDEDDPDYEIEGRYILANVSGPIYIKYVKKITDTTTFDALFVEALAARIALELCEKRTNSRKKKENLERDYKLAVRAARKANAFEGRSRMAPQDSWLAARTQAPMVQEIARSKTIRS